MRKEWVKRENIYYKPFYKQKSKMILLILLILTILVYFYIGNIVNNLPVTSDVFTYLLLCFTFLSSCLLLFTCFSTPFIQIYFNESSPRENSESPHGKKTENEIKIVRGTRLRDYDSYKPSFDKKFHCLDKSKIIIFQQLNDDYCDCPDGSDEPSTNACENGKFYCNFQKRHITGRGKDVHIKSSFVNDNVCDCCDGSDEWLNPLIKCIIKCI